MDQQTYAAMMALLEGIDGKVDALAAQQDGFVTRLERAENSISRLWLAVFGLGPLILTGVGFLYILHLTSK